MVVGFGAVSLALQGVSLAVGVASARGGDSEPEQAALFWCFLIN